MSAGKNYNYENDFEFSVSGFMVPDEEGMNILMQKPSAPFLLKTLIPARKFASWRWWLTRRPPPFTRNALCERFGHPALCCDRSMTCEMVALDYTDSRGEASWEFESTGRYFKTEEECALCGWTDVTERDYRSLTEEP